VSAKRCEAVGASLSGALALSTINGGMTWTIQKLPTSSVILDGVSCRSSSVCEAVGYSTMDTGVALGTVNGGATWSNQTLPGHPFDLIGIACVALPAACFAGGLSLSGSGLVLVYR
jgi:hypothetical protein